MEISDSAIWGLALIASPLIILVILICCPGRKWIAPLMFIVPFTILFISGKNSTPMAIFLGLGLAVFLYGFYFLLVLLVSALRKSKKVKDA